MNPIVTVIMPVRNEAGHIEATLAPLLVDQSIAFEVLVVDGESTDATCNIVRELQRKHSQIKLFSNPQRLSSAGRNIAVRKARGEYIVLIDGHCEIRNRFYLRDVIQAFENTGADCLGRPQPLDVTNATWLQTAIALARSSRLGHHPASHIYSSKGTLVKAQSVAIAYRREVFNRVGLFDDTFDACEDVEFNHRVDAAGMKCYLVPDLTIYYQPRKTIAALFQQMSRYGRGRVRLLRKHPETFSISVFLPLLFFGSLGLLPLVSPFLARLMAGTYIATICVTSALLARGARTLAGLWLPFVLLSIHAGAAWGVLIELLRNLTREEKTPFLAFAETERSAV